jgi:hypothetical protein
MDSTVAALIGAIIGGLLSVLASWLAQRVQSRSNWLVQEIKQRQALYSQFVEAASCCFADALQEHEPETARLAALYGEIGRMRLISTEQVVREADKIAHKILDAYASDNHTKVEIVDFLARDTIDLFADFGNACRAEIVRLQPARVGIEGPLSYRSMMPAGTIARRPNVLSDEAAA